MTEPLSALERQDRKEREHMSNQNNPSITVAPAPLDQAEYIEAVDIMAHALYGSLQAGNYTRDVLLTLETATKHGVMYDQLPSAVKLCFVRQAMAMIPKPAPAEAPKEQKTTTAQNDAGSKNGEKDNKNKNKGKDDKQAAKGPTAPLTGTDDNEVQG